MKKYIRILSVITILTFLCVSVSVFVPSVHAVADDNLGTIERCFFDSSTSQAVISGTVSHKLLVSSGDAELELYRILPWENIETVVFSSDPLMRFPVKVRFDFTVPCRTLAEKNSMFALIVAYSDGKKELLTVPHYIEHTSGTLSSLGFKGVATDKHSAALESGAGCAIVDIFLDKLENGKRSGYFYSIDDNSFYYDRDYIDTLDTVIRSYCASDTDILLRFLVSSDGQKLACTPDFADLALYRGIVVDSSDALTQVYAYTDFLCSRYCSAEFGKVTGIILGRGADVPEINNYCALFNEDYFENYSRTLAIIGSAVSDSVGEGRISLIVPVTDSLEIDENGKYICHAAGLLNYVSEYIYERTGLSFTVMCESTHNPYGIYNDFFVSPKIPDIHEADDDSWEELSETGSAGSESVFESGSDSYSSASMPQEHQELSSDESSESPGDDTDGPYGSDSMSEYAEQDVDDTPRPIKNTDECGFFCTDNPERINELLRSLRMKFNSVRAGYIWCWYPDNDTDSAALSVGYTYNYLSSAANGANAFIVSFDDSTIDSFGTISHLFKYISTESSESETAFSRKVFGISSWDEIIEGFNDKTGIYEEYTEWELKKEFYGIKGSIDIWNFTERNGDQDWYRGLDCELLKSVSTAEGKVLRARMHCTESAGNYADIGCICSPAEPLLFCNSLAFELRAGEYTGDLFEIRVKIYGNNMKIDSSAVVNSGEKTILYLDTTDFPENTAIDAVRICVRRVTGDGDFDFDLLRISINSVDYNSESLAELISDARENIRNDENGKTEETGKKILGTAVIGAISVISFGIARNSDSKRRKKGDL